MSWVNRHLRSGPPRSAGEAVRYAREDFGYSQDQLASAVGLSVSKVRRTEGGARPVDAEYLERLFGVLPLEGVQRDALRAAAGLDREPDDGVQWAGEALPPLFRQHEVRHTAIANLNGIREELLAAECIGVELGLVREIAIPAIERAIGALSLDPSSAREWLAMPSAVAQERALLAAVRRAFSYAGNAAAIAGVIDLVTRAEQLLHALHF